MFKQQAMLSCHLIPYEKCSDDMDLKNGGALFPWQPEQWKEQEKQKYCIAS